MKKKDLITLGIACIVIGASIYFMISLLSPKKTETKKDTSENKETQQMIPEDVDNATYTTVNTLSDYGKPALSGIGKSDLFAGF